MYHQAARLVLIATLLTTGPTTMQAATVTVGQGTTASCSEAALRTAVAQGGLITFNCGGAAVITVSDDLIVSSDTIIDGGGTQQGGLITLSGGSTTRVLLTQNKASLTVRNLTIRDGKEPGSDGRGGAIRGGWQSPVTLENSIFLNNDGTAGDQEGGAGAVFVHETTLTVRDSLFTGNHGVNGGAINNLLSNLFVTNSIFRDNSTTGYGGAIYTDGASFPINDAIGGTISIRSSRFENNIGYGQGGGVFLFGYPPDTIAVEGSAFVGNRVEPDAKGDALGGGARVGNANITLVDTLFAGNVSRSQGGALWQGEAGQINATNLTLANNRAVANDAADIGGLGGAYVGSKLICTNCTIAGNHAGFQGGAIWGNGPNITFKNTIIANNTANNDNKGWNVKHNCGGYPLEYASDAGGNLEWPSPNPNDSTDGTCVKNVRLADPKLIALADNGGPGQTMALAADSPALDAASGCPASDARGVARPQGTACDIGAFELVQRLTLSPSVVFVGATAFTLMLDGAGFTPQSRIQWNGVDLPTTFVASTRLTAAINQSRLSAPATITITVSNSTLAGQPLRIVTLTGRVYVPLVKGK